MKLNKGDDVPSHGNLVLLLATLIGSFIPQAISAEFTLNFQKTGPVSGWATFDCGAGSTYSGEGCGTAGGTIDPDDTPFFQEIVGVNGRNYWHQIVGDPADGFAMEIYASAWNGGYGSGNSLFVSASGGKTYQSGFSTAELMSGNGWDPLRSTSWNSYSANDYTGNATGDPRKMIMRQVLGGSWDGATWSCEDSNEFCYDFEKAEDAANSDYNLGDIRSLKPVITMKVNESLAGMSSMFKLDMSNSDYLDSSTAGTILNTLTLTEVPEGNFDMSTDTQFSTVTGGRYIFNPGTNPDADELGWVDINQNSFEFDKGSYTYEDGGLDLDKIDWESYRNNIDNYWYGSGNEDKCDSGAVFGNCP